MAKEAIYPRAFYAGSGKRRSYGKGANAKPGESPIPASADPLRLADGCPEAVLDTAPDGSGVGVWVLIKSDDGSCTYEYGGGIA